MSVGSKPRMVSVGALLAAYEAGKKANRYRFARLSPYYERPALDKFWFAGFDGEALPGIA